MRSERTVVYIISLMNSVIIMKDTRACAAVVGAVLHRSVLQKQTLRAAPLAFISVHPEGISVASPL